MISIPMLILSILLMPSLLDLSKQMERDRKRRSRHRGIMCGPGGPKKRGRRRW